MHLLDAAKKLKEKNTQIKAVKDKVVIQEVEWDLDPRFIGEPMVPRVLKQLSLYVDQKLIDYSSIYGANPATNMPRAVLDYGDEPTLNLNNVRVGHNPTPPRDHEVERFFVQPAESPLNQENGQCIIMDDPHLLDAAEQIEVQRTVQVLGANGTVMVNDNNPITDLRVHPGVRTREELEARVRNDEGFILDDGIAYGPQSGIADEYGGPLVEAYIPENAAVIEDEHVASEARNIQKGPVDDPGTIQMWKDRFKAQNALTPGKVEEQDTLLSSEIKIPPGSSLLRGAEAAPEDIHVLHSTDTPTKAEIQAGIVYTRQSFEPLPEETTPSVPPLATLLNPGELNKAAATFLQAAAEEIEASDEPENLTMLLPGSSEGAVFGDSGKIIYPDRFVSGPPLGNADEVEAHFANTGDVLFQPSPSPGISLGMDIHEGVEIHDENVVVPAEDQETDYHHEMTFNNIVQEGRRAGVQVEGINPVNFRLNDEHFRNGAEGYDPTREGVDNHVYTGGALPGVRFRIRDSFIRNRPLTLKVPQFELMGPGSKGKDIAYVTSYTIEHQTQKIKARVITAPPDLTLDDEAWFGLCTNGTEDMPSTLKAVVKNTVQANLCIYKPSRVAFYGKGVDARAEKIALETLRDMITEQEFRHYLRYGFLTVRGSSGRVYQIPRDGHHTKIWERGKLIEEVCVRIKDQQIPPTDNVIAFKVMIETNEDLFKALGNVYKNKEAA